MSGRTLNGFQSDAFQDDAFQMPDVAVGGGALPVFWLSMYMDVRRRDAAKRKREQEERQKREEETVVAMSRLPTATLRYVAMPSYVTTQLGKRLRANDEARAMADFLKFMESLCEVELE